MTYVVTLPDNTAVTVDADAFSVDDGCLTFFAATAEPAGGEVRARSPVVAIARGAWRMLRTVDAEVHVTAPGAEPPPPRLIPATRPPERTGW
ncbi:hypothetical protein [Mycobacterium sp. OTB74]|jgi:hypothetical protein|uniref:hypothetical protein n=1 Tax=Mycobacterium sp. OTB74 TaxID=1853452 RepID=UPI002474CDD4|nr:hypothetical protein [Mycobacterium sp. OTB74]MDH6245032.1 hypothetical protein [Mycobacterium sp. OTB74]